MALSYKLKRLREIREKKHLSLVDLALRSGMERTRIDKFERGEANAQRMTMYKLAEALGVEPAELMEPQGG
jgi:transcriptional regulator with XRE-family HTH domain